MSDSTAEAIETLLESVQERVEDPDLIFKLRTARQLVVLCKEEKLEYRTALAEADLDDETRDSLRQLGYIE